MKKIITIVLVAIVATTSSTYAQYASDALRFSQTNYGSSARFKAMGNAQIGVGGDMSSLGGNPAGLGLFTKSEFSLTPEFNQTGVNATYLSQNQNTDKNQLNVNQLGAVFFSPAYKRKGQDTKNGLVSMVFGLGYHRNNDFSMESNYGGSNNVSSITDYFAEIAGSSNPNSLIAGTPERIAYDDYLISYDNVANNYFSETFANGSDYNTQSKNEMRTGSVSEFNFAAAANISNQIYIGASIGLLNIRYNSDAQYMETGKAREYLNDNLTGNNINYKLLFNQNQITKGSGINGRLGLIFRAAEGLRLGATLQTPSWFVIDDSTTEQLDNRGTIRGSSDSKTYDFTYNLRTPLKGSLGGSYIIGGQALISADVDFIDYSSTRFSSNGGGYSDVINDNNASVRKNFQSAINYRFGLEYKIDLISLRGGYAVNGSPYKTDETGMFDTKIYSGGIGYRTNKYSLDLAYQRLENTNILSPYTLNNGNEPLATTINTKNNVFLTFGLRF
ncbi:OmpP1/FadL family transporter [Pedobacter insulae]|uniref:Long-chain fatty acid transport protein n=1 Tax=Pedobacter insulae TaxID=414048 RepID=A0A1I2URK4_9SPHI|nr:hypothetical protein [Pedobacter insulae]SFG79713.1 Long-chain fatty acid transport protein [Pedobacter insulae]